MSNRQFTWWRRFYVPTKLNTKLMWRGLSPLLQRIEAGEFDIDHLMLEHKLEDYIFKKEVEELKKTASFKKHSIETKEDIINNMRKNLFKRKEIIMSNHMKTEYNIIESLYSELCKEFNLQRDYVINFIDNFDGTLRELYYTLRALNRGENITKEQIKSIPRHFREIPRHFLKENNLKYYDAWKNIMLLHNYVEYQGGFIKKVS